MFRDAAFLRVAAVSIAAGDAAGLLGAAPLGAARAAAVLAGAVAIAAFRTRAARASAAAAFLCAGLALGSGVRARERALSERYAAFEPRLVRVEGEVASPPVPLLAARGLDEATSFDLRAGRETLRVRIDGPAPFPFARGDRVRVRGWLQPIPGPTNPGEEDRRPASYRECRVAFVRAGSGENVTVLETASDHLSPRRLLDAARARAAAAIDRAAPGRGGGLLRSLLLGDRDVLAGGAGDAMRETGTIHLLAISGLHVLLLVRALRLLLDRIPLLGERGRRASVLLFLAAYASMVGFTPSVVRAATMAAAGEAAAALGRRLPPVEAVALAAAVLVAADPDSVLDAGAQLSFAAVLALVLLAARVERALPFPRPLARPIALTIAASLATAPIVAARFQVATPGALLANLVAAPVVSATLVAGAPAALLEAVAPNPVTARALAALAFAFDALVRLLEAFARLPGVAVAVPAPGPVALVLAFALLAAAAAARKGLGLFLALSGAATVSGLIFSAPPPAAARLTVLDVGQGAAAILETPSGRAAAIDCGSSNRPDAGSRVVAAFLLSRGATRLDLLFLSHPDADHVNAVAGLARRIAIGDVRGSEAVAALGLAPASVAKGDAFDLGPGHRIVALFPPRGHAPDGSRGAARSRNDASLVLRVETPGGTALVPGDLQDDGLRALLSGTPPAEIRADVLVLPHHGSFAVPLGDLLDRVRPRFAVASARRGFVPDSTRGALAERGIPLLETSESGAVVVTFFPSGAVAAPAVRPP